MRSCKLFDELGARPALRVFKILFCESSFGRCARFELSSAGAFVPHDLLPDGRKNPLHAAKHAV
jgi:hypothetical protein